MLTTTCFHVTALDHNQFMLNTAIISCSDNNGFLNIIKYRSQLYNITILIKPNEFHKNTNIGRDS